jgi:hypothetical protein
MAQKEYQLNFPFHPDEVRKLRSQIAEELRRKEAPEMQQILDAGRLTTEDYAVTINAR